MTDHRCSICQRISKEQDLIPLSAIRPTLQKFIQRTMPLGPEEQFICTDDLNKIRNNYLEEVLEEEKGELTELEGDVLRSLREQELITSNVNSDYSETRTFGERLSDHLASFGGSWAFIILFGCMLLLWIAWNAWNGNTAFDPYPFILLNLVLSCLAALQAPIIMMSQNRQEAKDRLRAENDYRINLKAELEIKHLNEKIDHLVMRQWQRLLEIQNLQIQLMEEIKRAQHSSGLAIPEIKA